MAGPGGTRKQQQRQWQVLRKSKAHSSRAMNALAPVSDEQRAAVTSQADAVFVGKI